MNPYPSDSTDLLNRLILWFTIGAATADTEGLRRGAMRSEVRTFKIRDAAVLEDEAALAEFLRAVEVKRIETAFAGGAWHILVMFEDLRRREETAQIQSTIITALNQWRKQAAADLGIERDALLSDSAVREIARYAPTTVIELNVISGTLDCHIGEHAQSIVLVVRETLEALTDSE
jgi:ribonuclease D